ncbi:MAG: hypothetical protein AB7N91_22590 [Candidatus Tectimicrobiota bacterium]
MRAVTRAHASPDVMGPVPSPAAPSSPHAPGRLAVRWKRRRLRRRADTAWDAVLVRSVWHQGAARQQLVAYLASIRASYRTAPAHQGCFWARVDARLESLALDPAVRQAVETRLTAVVPRPTAAALQAVATQRHTLTQWAATAVSPALPPRAHDLATWPYDRHEGADREGVSR